MKKLFHLGIFAIIAFTISSCSKSTKDLLVNEPSETPALPNQGMNPIPPATVGEGVSAIFDYINEPISLRLGDPSHNLSPGSFAVFYVVFTDGEGIDPASAATLTTKDDNTSDVIQTYNLISCDDADSYGIVVPDELIGKRYMFAIVELDNQYTDKTVALYSEITINAFTTFANIDHAFTVSYYVIPI